MRRVKKWGLQMKQRDFTQGKIFGPMFSFVIPIILTNLLQTMYGIADNIIVGKFSGDELALAAVGTTGSISALVLNLVVGLAVGSGVVISQAYGARDYEKVSRSIHTFLTFALIFGLCVGALAVILTPKLLLWTGVQEVLMSRATLYLRIIFLGYPATAVYNYAAAALRAVGDSKTSLRILGLSGLLNVGLNLIFVFVFHMSVGGVALATAISKYASVISILVIMYKRRDEIYHFSPAKMGIHKKELVEMLRFGLPSGIQNSMFSVSNIFFTVALNSLDTYVLSAKTIAMNLTNVANNVSSSYMNATTTFCAQNYGARRFERIGKSLGICLLQGTAFTFLVGILMYLLIGPISTLYISASDPLRELIIECSRSIAAVTLPWYWLCSVMNATSGALRGVGASTIPMVTSITGICLYRILWILFVFPLESFHNARGIYIGFPTSWTLVILANAVALFFVFRKIKVKFAREKAAEKASIFEEAMETKA